MSLNSRLTLDALKVLDAIDRKGSFAAAAEALYRVPSTVTYTVQKLESELGIALFDRQGQRAVLTEAGRELLAGGRHVLRAAQALESRVKRVASGWEAELRIAIDGIIPVVDFLPIVAAFCAEGTGTQIRLLAEVYGGCWDALVGGRADLIIGAPGEGPAGGGYATFLIGTVQWVFAVAPDHPLMRSPEPLTSTEIGKHRAVAGGDTSRYLPARTSGIVPGQEVLTVPHLEAKVEAQCLGLGVGFVPLCCAASALAQGRLVIREVQEPKPPHQLWMAWRTERTGKALGWFIDHAETINSVLALARSQTHGSRSQSHKSMNGCMTLVELNRLRGRGGSPHA
ncbi:MAG: LysR family transcriptional regulator [Gammaproteobacteria bacterium]